MSAIVQVNFKLNVPAPEFLEAAAGLGEPFAQVPGLVWKIWMLNEEAGEAGGLYLFESDAARQAFLQSELAAAVKAAPILRDFEAKVFDVIPGVTALTRGPVAAVQTVTA